jgi:2-haloacid dehalogenase
MTSSTISRRRPASGRSPAARLTGAALALVFAVLVCSRPPAVDAGAPERPRFKAVAFDYFVLFNPDSVLPEAERLFPGRGRELTNLWRTRQFEYSWLRSITGRYEDFFAVTEDALVYAAASLKLELTAASRQRLLDTYLHLTPWPDAADGLQQLRASGVRVITIANFSPMMLEANARNAGLTPFFDALVSTDANHSFKPEPRAYHLGMERLHLRKQEIVFAAFGGWDAAGAKAFGYPTVWVNRFDQPLEELGVQPDTIVPDMKGLLRFVLSGVRDQRHEHGGHGD